MDELKLQSNVIPYKPRVYLSSRVSKDYWLRNDALAGLLSSRFDVFVPHQHQSDEPDHTKLEIDTYLIDLDAMKFADIFLIYPPHGRDCAWEMGWAAANKNQLSVIYDDGTSTDYLRDLMLKGGVHGIITTSEASFKQISTDPILKNKDIVYGDKKILSLSLFGMFLRHIRGKT